jgi:hypothetical protein
MRARRGFYARLHETPSRLSEARTLAEFLEEQSIGPKSNIKSLVFSTSFQTS